MSDEHRQPDLEAGEGDGAAHGAKESKLADVEAASVTGAAARAPTPSLSRQSSFLSRTPSLVRQLSDRVLTAGAAMGIGEARTYYCEICFESYPNSEGVSLGKCGHSFCRDCLGRYVEVAVTERKTDLKCYAMGSGAEPCGAEIGAEDVEAVCSRKVFDKWRRFVAERDNPDTRECPKCGRLQVGAASAPAMECGSCGQRYCFFHALAHQPTASCAEYQRHVAALDRAAAAAVADVARPCPWCGQLTEKLGGCNAMKCASCRRQWCWLCGRGIGDGEMPDHYQWWNVAGCPNRQLDEGVRMSGVRACLVRLLAVLYTLVIGPPALLAALPFWLLSLPCICCARSAYEQSKMEWDEAQAKSKEEWEEGAAATGGVASGGGGGGGGGGRRPPPKREPKPPPSSFKLLLNWVTCCGYLFLCVVGLAAFPLAICYCCLIYSGAQETRSRPSASRPRPAPAQVGASRDDVENGGSSAGSNASAGAGAGAGESTASGGPSSVGVVESK